MTAVAIAVDAATYSGTLPVMFINTENNTAIDSKEVYIKATYYIDPMGQKGVEALGSAEEPLEMQIRGRGNYSWWGFDKKPYRIKLAEKQPLLGLDKSKHFALLAHADDTFGFMRNIVGFQLSRLIGMPWTPADAPLEVVLNGDYIGLYFLTETIRVDKNRVNIIEQPDLTTSPDEITGGWLVEIDNYDSDPHVTINEKDEDNTPIIFTYKTPEELSPMQESYLLDQVNSINDAIYDPDLENDTWEDYVDTDILARYYIVQEVVDDYESFHGSCYMYKNKGDGKWMFGPVWDFGNAFTYNKTQYIYHGRQWHQTWIEQMCRHPHFQNTIKNVWSEFSTGRLNEIYSYIDTYAAKIASAVEADATRWPQYNNQPFADRVNTVISRLRESTRWLNNQWEIKSCYNVCFSDNGNPKWNQVYAYCWSVTDDHVNLYLGDWPGSPLTFNETTGMWDCEFEAGILPPGTQIIFNNGKAKDDNQTADLNFVNNAIYNREGVISEGIADTDKEQISIYSSQGALIIISPVDTSLRLCDLSGRYRIINVSAGTTSITSLSPGFYIVNGKKILL